MRKSKLLEIVEKLDAITKIRNNNRFTKKEFKKILINLLHSMGINAYTSYFHYFQVLKNLDYIQVKGKEIIFQNPMRNIDFILLEIEKEEKQKV